MCTSLFQAGPHPTKATQTAQAATVGSKKFTEGVILGEVARLALERAGVPATHRRELGGSRILWDALRAGSIDVYPDYTGTLRFEILAGQHLPNDAALPRALAAQGLAMSRPIGFSDGYALAMRAAEATLALRQGQARAALRGLEALLRTPGDEGWRYALAALDGGKDDKEAARVLGELLDRDAIPGSLEAWLAFGGFAQRTGSQPLAERIVGEVVRRFPGEPRVALLRAAQLREAGKFDAARQALQALRGRAQDDADLRIALAAEYDALGDSSAAAAVMATGPQDEDSYEVRASLLDKAGDKQGLAALYDELRRDATRPDPARWMLLGQIAESLQRYDEALTWYRSVPGGEQRWPARAYTRCSFWYPPL